jgi:ATP-binding protein involved in chromosome partitioning
VVTTPQQVAISDVRKAADMFRNEQLNIPLLGVVENMSWFIPPDAPDKKYFIFGQGGAGKFSTELHIPLLAQIPFVMDVTKSGDSGVPIAMADGSPVAEAYRDLAENVARQVAISNVVKETFKK